MKKLIYPYHVSSYDDPWDNQPNEEPEFEEVIDINLDATIVLYEDGIWEYKDDDFTWLEEQTDRNNDEFTSSNYGGLVVATVDDVIEAIDSLMETLLPMDAGEYHVTGNAELYFDVFGVTYESSPWQESEEEDPYDEKEYDYSNAESSLNFNKSVIKNFKYTKEK